jgi:hypothetical protein
VAKTKTPRRKSAKKRTASKSVHRSTKRSSCSPRSARAAAGSTGKPKRACKSGATKAGVQEVTIDRRRSAERRGVMSLPPAAAVASAPAPLERRRKVNRRRQIDPTTCERDYSVDEVEFMTAIDDYKRKSGRMFPTCSEVLEVVRGLGYIKLSPAVQAQEISLPLPEAVTQPVAAME